MLKTLLPKNSSRIGFSHLKNLCIRIIIRIASNMGLLSLKLFSIISFFSCRFHKNFSCSDSPAMLICLKFCALDFCIIFFRLMFDENCVNKPHRVTENQSSASSMHFSHNNSNNKNLIRTFYFQLSANFIRYANIRFTTSFTYDVMMKEIYIMRILRWISRISPAIDGST